VYVLLHLQLQPVFRNKLGAVPISMNLLGCHQILAVGNVVFGSVVDKVLRHLKLLCLLMREL
jgi:hypothetical protein